MRPLELVLVVGQVLTFLVLVTPRLRAIRWLRCSATVGALLSVNSTFQVEELVSHGYLVAAIDDPYTVGDAVFPDGHHVELDRRVADSQRCLTRSGTTGRRRSSPSASRRPDGRHLVDAARQDPPERAPGSADPGEVRLGIAQLGRRLVTNRTACDKDRPCGAA